MSLLVFLHSSLLILSLGISYIISKSSLASNQLQIAAIVFIFYFFIKRISFLNTLFFKHVKTLETAFLLFICLNIVLATGSLTSPFFFLMYFVLFAISILLESELSITTTIGIIVLFLFDTPVGGKLDNYIPLISLPLLFPFALLLAKQYHKDEIQRQIISSLKRSKQKVITNSTKDKEDQFLFLSLIIKNHLKHILESLEKSDSYPPKLTDIKQKVKRIILLIDQYEKDTN